ncbi:hypothetical protein [Paenibacillus sp. OAS669]|uniref:hypothetical protein n=1 Tax=Paenibacillus sp. OAS669 TaxID=2663821 RepID=UPI00178A6685|nr:hypothetical protein [Paenibacillus sp. OAS669]MBE1446517.1 hypothetical protein [Paenibacillus sp. OAS669]
MSNSMYHRSSRYLYASSLLLALMVCLAGFKSYASWVKVDLYAQAEKEQAAGHDLEAEALYQKARSNTMINYKNREIDAALEALRPATELKRGLMSIVSDIQSAVPLNDVPTLVKAYDSYQSIKADYSSRDETAQQRFADAEAAYQVEKQLTEAFAGVKEGLLKSLQTAVSKKAFDNENTIAYLAQIPAAYFKDEKTKKQELASRLKAYDQARMESVFQKKSFGEAVDEAVRIRKFYTSNSIQAEWLGPLIETNIQNSLAAMLKKTDLKAFIDNSQKVLSVKELADSRTKLSTYVQNAMKGQFNRAEQLVSAKKFAEAIELYTVLNSYKDTSKEIRDAELRWLQADPSQLLRKALDANVKLTNIASAKGLWGSQLAAAAVADNQSVVLVRLMPDQSINQAAASIDGKQNIKSITLTDQFTMRGLPVLLIEAESKQRKARYIVYEAQSADLRKLLDIEADGLVQERPGILAAEHAAGEPAGQKTYYEYKDGQYTVSKMKTEAADIALSELPKQKIGSLVRFPCTIVSVDGDTAVVQLNNDYVLLTGSMKFKPGPVTVTGTYVDKSRVSVGSSQTATAYKITVTALTSSEPAKTEADNRRPLP